MRLFYIDINDEDDRRLLYKIQRASRMILGKSLNLCQNADACLDAMEREGYIKQLDDEDENILFMKEVCLFILNHQMVIYMLTEEFDEILEYLKYEE